MPEQSKKENLLLARGLAFCSAKPGGKSSARQRARILLRKTRRKILCSPEGSHFAPQNQEENPLLARGLAFCSAKPGGKSSARQRARILLRKTRRKILCSPEGSHFAPQNQEENPLLARGLAFCSAKPGGKSSARQRARILLRKTRRKILCSPEGSHFAPQNQEENPLLARGLAFCSAKPGGKSSARQRARILLRKTRRKILCSPEGSHFAPQNQEENPLLARGLAFCSAKLGGLICCCNMREYG